jgi:transposase
MIRVQLPADEVDALESLLRATPDAKLRHRVQIVLMAHRGRPHGQIAQDLACSRSSVQRWLNAYLEAGVDGLRPRKARGAKPRLTDDLAPLLKQWVLDGPAACGLDRANWTFAELADHLAAVRGVRVQKSALQAFCHKHGIRPYRPTYRYLRGQPDKQQQARQELADLKKGLRLVNRCS